jgi:hypothetical protein
MSGASPGVAGYGERFWSQHRIDHLMIRPQRTLPPRAETRKERRRRIDKEFR